MYSVEVQSTVICREGVIVLINLELTVPSVELYGPVVRLLETSSAMSHEPVHRVRGCPVGVSTVRASESKARY